MSSTRSRTKYKQLFEAATEIANRAQINFQEERDNADRLRKAVKRSLFFLKSGRIERARQTLEIAQGRPNEKRNKRPGLRQVPAAQNSGTRLSPRERA